MNTKGVEDGISDEQECGCNINPRYDCPVCLAHKAPTFSYQLAMALTRNGADAPHMQAEINRFLYENGWKTMQEVKS